MSSVEAFDKLLMLHFDCERQNIRLLDFGCGNGSLVSEFRQLGYDAYGCDFRENSDPKIRTIQREPYRLPFDDATFDAVVSSTVFEHVIDKVAAFRELRRVLKADGIGIHNFPAKWRPVEPHINIPLVPWISPHVPSWWLSLWAWLGVRNEYQSGFSWRQAAAANKAFCRDALLYWTKGRYREAMMSEFGRCQHLDLIRFKNSNRRIPMRITSLGLAPLAAFLTSHFVAVCIGHGPIKKLS